MAFRVIDRAQQVACARMVAAAFDPDGRLRGRGHPCFGIEPHAHCILAQPVETGSGKESRIGFARLELGHPRGDIAANTHHRQIGTQV